MFAGVKHETLAIHKIQSMSIGDKRIIDKDVAKQLTDADDQPGQRQKRE